MSKIAIFPSNTISANFPDNTTSNFTVQLSDHLIFPEDEEWRVALVEAQIPITFYNVDSSMEQRITFKDDKGHTLLKIPDGFYPSTADLAKKINKEIESFDLIKQFFNKLIFRENTRQATFRLKKNQSVVLSDRLADMFGFPELMNVPAGRKTKTYLADDTDPWRNFHQLFIYSDLVQDKILNEKSVPLLGTVSVSKFEFGALTVRNFLTPEFAKVRHGYYSTINFQIRNEADQLVKFRAGSVLLKLIFTNARGTGN